MAGGGVGNGEESISLKKTINSYKRQNLSSATEDGSGRKSLSESLSVDPNFPPNNVSHHSQFDHDEEYNTDVRMDKNSDESSCPQATDHRTNQNDPGNQMNISGTKINVEEQQVLISGISNQQNQGFKNFTLESDDVSFPENHKSGSLSTPSNIYHYYESKVAALIRKMGLWRDN